MFDRQLGKVIKYSLDSYEGEEKLYALTSRMARALIQTTEYLRWNTRHMTLPTDLPDIKLLGDWVDNLDERLMLNVNPLENLCAELTGCSDEILDILKSGVDGTNDSDTAKELRDILNEYITNMNNNGSKFNPSPVVTDSQRKLFGECLKIVTYTHDIIIDVLEQLETFSNNIEFIQNSLDSLPFFKFLTNAIPVDSWIGDIDYFLSLTKEEFDSGYTVDIPDGSQWKMTCKLYCACKSDKTITIERIYNAFVSLLSGYTIPSLDNVDEWLSTLVGVNDNSELAVYALYAMFWGVGRLSSYFGNVRLSDATIKILLKLGEEDVSNDPNDYCEDCAGDWEHTFNFEIESGAFVTWGGPFGGIPGNWIEGVGWVSDFATAGSFAYNMVQIKVEFAATDITFLSMTFQMSNGSNAGLTQLLVAGDTTFGASTAIPPDGFGTFGFHDSAPAATFIGLRIQSGNQGGSSDPGGVAVLKTLTVNGLGANPFI